MIRKRCYHFFYYWFPVLFYCLIIFIQSSYPIPIEISDIAYADKLFHFAGYSLLGLLFLRGFRNSKFRNENRLIMATSILLTGLYGASDELHQHYVPYRTGDIWDVLFGLLGGIFGVYVYKTLVEKYPKTGRI